MKLRELLLNPEKHRKIIQESKKTMRELAKEYGVSLKKIWRIKHDK
jgi:hypothetical protein|tara:strand:- start:920 stop:1057 length:138 start_codon:yes stop_codon:yes gene_type:complete